VSLTRSRSLQEGIGEPVRVFDTSLNCRQSTRRQGSRRQPPPRRRGVGGPSLRGRQRCGFSVRFWAFRQACLGRKQPLAPAWHS